ncbi:ninjurin-1-like isoform X2 [Dicentrarchus labrax]|uniref:ninjurin-1-like isoform X2 n=1 Tax=Dicentrarchus labrax TaxID=13489 RepID=UPI0021F5FBF1|nr:ninjurin-1-like isoform X2 [Dicentrarchus labrax]
MMMNIISSNRGSGTEASRPDAWPGSPAPLNINHYANKKSAAESMLDVALLMANASQLKAVLEQGPNFSFYTSIITLISISLCLQVTVGILLIFIAMSSPLTPDKQPITSWTVAVTMATRLNTSSMESE